jgi:hypothetical protein
VPPKMTPSGRQRTIGRVSRCCRRRRGGYGLGWPRRGGGAGEGRGVGKEKEEDLSKAKSMYVCSMSLVYGTIDTY